MRLASSEAASFRRRFRHFTHRIRTYIGARIADFSEGTAQKSIGEGISSGRAA